MPQFYVSRDAIRGNVAVITGDDYRHLVHVRRIRNGSVVYLCDETGTLYYGLVSETDSSSVKVRITGSYQRTGTGLDIRLYLCLLKGGNFEYAIRKSVEVGVNRIEPVISVRTVPEPENKIEQKTERWNKIAREASKQCMRVGDVSVGLPRRFDDVIDADLAGIKIIGHPGASRDIKEFMRNTVRPEGVSMLIGPEGGFSDSEVAAAENAGWDTVNFGFTHLRAETAASIIPALVIYEWGKK